VIEATVIYWRDIPTQIVLGRGRKAIKHQLSNRFMVAVDKAAMNAGASDTDSYLECWRKVSRSVQGADDKQAVAVLAAELEEQYPTSRLAKLARQGGTEQDKANPST